jgi:hypothetical protein
MPIHNDTFDLALHPWYEPFARLSKAAASYNIEIATPIMVKKVLLNQSRINQRWCVFDYKTVRNSFLKQMKHCKSRGSKL